MSKAVELVSAAKQLTRGLAHAMILAAARRQLATYLAPALERAGYAMALVLDLDEMFRA